MKKRIIFLNGIILFLTLSLFLIISVFILNYYNNKSSERELNNHVLLISELYNGENAEEVINSYQKANKNLRITFISFDGEVVKDSLIDIEFESHLDRPEILNLGEVYTRYSESLNTYMMYLAHKDNGLYIRVAMPQKSINAIVNSFLLFCFLTLIALTIITTLVLNSVNKKALKPLNKVVNKLSKLAGHDSYYGDDVETISSHIDDINLLINEKINAIIDEKSKVDFIINNLEQGVIVVNSNKELILVNDYVLRLKNFKLVEVLNKNFIYLIRDISFQEAIACTIDEGSISSFDLPYKSKLYLINITPVNTEWTNFENAKNGAFITMSDVTEERKIEKMKREFFANASHELKSPLTTIIGYQQMISEGIITSMDEILDASKRTSKEAIRMHQMILGMLDLSKLESKEETSFEEVNLKDAVIDVLDLYQKELSEKNITVSLNLEDLYLLMNPNHLNQLVRNLIENAIKYNIPNGELKLSISNQKKELIIQDSGIGIASEDQSRIFERFYRVDKGRSKDKGGTGLGLSIVKHICNLYHDNINLTSKPNKGTTVKIQFNNFLLK
jgi:two-component system phosphate regulon sensor histidine kinase PhoR